MKKHTKGALAVGTAAALLLGGAGTLAYWSDSAQVDGGAINSGSLTLGEPKTGGWVYANGGGQVTEIVPGDSIEKTATFTIGASGDHLAATLTTPDKITYDVTSTPQPTTLQLDVDTAYELDGADAPETITEADNGKQVTATITVTFPYGTVANANDTQNLTAELDDITVSLEQVDPAGA